MDINWALITEIIAVVGFILTILILWGKNKEYLNEKKTNSEQSFKDVRTRLANNRMQLSEQAFHYYDDIGLSLPLQCEVGGSQLTADILAKREWIAQKPLPLDEIRIELEMGSNGQPVTTTDYSETIKKAKYLWPYKGKANLSRYASYDEAIRYIDPPKLFDNRDTFAVTGIETTPSSYKLTFRVGKYFDFQDTGDALAFELASIQPVNKKGILSPREQAKQNKKLRYRKVIGDPGNFLKRCVAGGIDTLTVFDADQNPMFVLHHREVGKVATAPGLYTVVPAGEFQSAVPSDVKRGSDDWGKITARDFGMWRNIMREFNEEFLGAPEIPYPDDYLTEPPFNQLMDARSRGELTPYFLGFVLDPMSLKPAILTVCVFKGDSFQKICPGIFQGGENLMNAEGSLYLGRGNTGIPFDQEHICTYANSYPMYPASKALLILAYQHRDALGIKNG